MAEQFLDFDDPSLQPAEFKKDLAALIRKKVRVIGPMTLLYMTSYIGLTVLAGFFRPLMSERALGPINVGFVLIAANYALSWGLAAVYVRIANSSFDPLATRIGTNIRRPGRTK